jgi:hypothetical protein
MGRRAPTPEPLNVRTGVFLTAGEEPTRDCASEYRLAAPCLPPCLPQCCHVILSCSRSAQEGHAMHHETRPMTVRTRRLTVS